MRISNQITDAVATRSADISAVTRARRAESGLTSVEIVMSMVMIGGALLAFATSIVQCMNLERRVTEKAAVLNRSRDVLEQIVLLPSDLLAQAFKEGVTKGAGATVELQRGCLDSTMAVAGLSDYQVEVSVPPRDEYGWLVEGATWSWLRRALSETGSQATSPDLVAEQVLQVVTPVSVQVSWKTKDGLRSQTFNTMVTKVQ